MKIRHHADLNTTLTTPFQVNLTDFDEGLQTMKKHMSNIPPSVILGLFLAGLAVILTFIIICYKRYRTRQLYEQTPQNFSSKPDLSLAQRWISDQQILSLSREQEHEIVPRETYDGKFIEVRFKTHKNCIYFPVEQKKDCYFEIEIMQLSSVIQLGFVHVDDISLICKKGEGMTDYEIDFDQNGVSVRTDGTTIIYGNNQINFPWKIQYGDTIGIGLTTHEGAIRVWVTKNGIIQNPPSQEQAVKYVEVKNQSGTTVAKKLDQDDEDQTEEQKQQKAKQKALAAKRKIELKSGRKFRYYAVLVSQISPLLPRKESIINWNIGAQNFRLYDAKILHGLLR